MTHVTSWTSKDPDAVQDYLFTIPLDEGDSVASATFEKLEGSVIIDNDPEAERVDAEITAWLSGGTDGETNVFRVAWLTAEGREDDGIITLATLAHSETFPLPLTGYVKPTPAHFVIRYPSFADVEPTTIQYWLTDAERYVDTTWMAGDYAPALMAHAAHSLTLSGLGTEAAATADIPDGITAMKIGTLGLSFDSALTRSKASGDYASTRYGSDFVKMRRRNKAGPRVSSPGAVPQDPRAYPTGET